MLGLRTAVNSSPRRTSITMGTEVSKVSSSRA
jgi:hypothetical protein